MELPAVSGKRRFWLSTQQGRVSKSLLHVAAPLTTAAASGGRSRGSPNGPLALHYFWRSLEAYRSAIRPQAILVRLTAYAVPLPRGRPTAFFMAAQPCWRLKVSAERVRALPANIQEV